MKQHFVGGIVQNALGEILLVGRSVDDQEMGGLWSLPAGGVEENETDEEALKREFKEETGLIIECGSLIRTIKREKWCVNIYNVSVVGGKLTFGLDKNIQKLSYFPLSKLPENLVMEAHCGIINFLLQSEGITPSQYSDLAESMFSAVYHSYLAPTIADFTSLDNYEIYKSILNNTPLKKFKCCIPFLLSECNTLIKIECLLAEILFCVWTLVDDVSDNRFQKYNSNTSLNSFSYKQNISSVYIAITDLYLFFKQRPDTHIADLVSKGLLKNARAQLDRFNRSSFIDIDNYLTHSQERSEFLGNIWSYSLKKAGNFEEAILIETIYPLLARIGQILNDYYDYKFSYKLEDIDNQTVTYLSMLLYKQMSATGTEEQFYKCWQSKDRRQYIQLIEEYNLPSLIENQIISEIETITLEISNSSISENKKNLLIFWIDMQFGKFVDLGVVRLSSTEKLLNLNNIIDELSQKIH